MAGMAEAGVAMNELLTVLQDISAPGTLAKQSALRATCLKIGYLKSMRHMNYAMTHERPDSSIMRWGRLVHQATLEPRKLPAIWTGKSRKGKDYDTWFDAQPKGVEITTAAEWADVLECRKSIMSNPEAAELLDGTEREMRIALNHSEFGRCVGTLDAWKLGYLTDLKTTTRIDAHSVERLFAQMAYHIQFGWYAWLLDQLGMDKMPVCKSILVETEPPYDCAVYELSRFDVGAGMIEAGKVASQYRLCEKMGVYPGTKQESKTITLPEYAYKVQAIPAGIVDGDLTDL